MRPFSLLALAVLFFGSVVLGLRAEATPNFILILTDDHGWSQTTYRADPRVEASASGYLETPNLQRLAEGGMRFTSGYSPAPLCTPTRRSILCGASAARCGTEFKSDWVPAEHLTIPKALKRANPDYRCAHFGKWGEQMISTPEECGYDFSDGMTGNNTGGMPATLGVKGGHENGPPHFIDNEDPKRTRTVTDSSLAFMREQVAAGRPFYLQASYYAQHLSVVCREETLAKYEKKGTPDRLYTPAWAAMMEELDGGIGRILDAIDELEIGGNTFVFFTADNGGRGTVPGAAKQGTLPNHPLTGAKHSLYEGGIRVPFLARGPGIEPGSVSHTPVVGYDFLPTLYDLAGGKEPGQSLAATVDGTSFRSLFAEPSGTIERAAGGLIFHRPRRLASAIREGGHKLRVNWKASGEIQGVQLYELRKDPREEGREITAGKEAVVKDLQSKLLKFLEEVDAERPQPATPKKAKKK